MLIFNRITKLILFVSLTILWGQNVCEKLTFSTVGKDAPKPGGFNSVGSSGKCNNGVLDFEANGHDFYWGWDRGGFAYLEMPSTGDFVFSAKITGNKANLFCKAEKIGLCARDGLKGNDRSVQIRWDGFYSGNVANAQVSWFYRYIRGDENTEFCSGERSSCFKEGGTGVTEYQSYLRISRVGTNFHLFVSKDGSAWTEVGTDAGIPFVLLAPTVYIGLIGSCGNFGNTLAMTQFSELTCTGPACPTGSAAIFRQFKSSQEAFSNSLGWQGLPLKGTLGGISRETDNESLIFRNIAGEKISP